MTIKKIGIILSLIFSISNAYAFSSNRTTYEFNYKETNIELIGSYFGREVLIKPRDDMFQVSNETIVNAYRNFFTAYHKQKLNWLANNTVGNAKNFTKYTQKHLQLYKNNLTHIYGYALYEKYVILLLKQKELGKKHIFVMIKDKDGMYKASSDFKELHSIQYEAIKEAFIGHGSLKIFKRK
ncbi:MAG TPA: hypothetical protein DCL21_03800, partial [Alphaproteobacteria bacterium]|nr:hypothetical protein [Alphaproteobacteria bacterium]